MRVRRINIEHDYPVIRTWWERRGGTPPQMELLSDFGIMVEDGELPMACAFLFTISNAPLAIVEWEATNPDVHSVRRRLEALNMAFDFFEDWSKQGEAACLITWVTAGRGDGRLLSQRGWTKPQGEPHEMLAFVPVKEAVCH